MKPRSPDRTKRWLLTVLAALATLTLVHLVLGSSLLWPAIYIALFLPLLVLVYLDSRRRGENALPVEDRVLDPEKARAEASRWHRWSVALMIGGVIFGGLLAGAGFASIPFLIVVALILLAIRHGVGLLIDRVT